MPKPKKSRDLRRWRQQRQAIRRQRRELKRRRSRQSQ
jgi:hypothetical protein